MGSGTRCGGCQSGVGFEEAVYESWVGSGRAKWVRADVRSQGGKWGEIEVGEVFGLA